MKRWNEKQKATIETPAIDAFLKEIEAVCRKHGFAISHEDSHGAFVVVKHTEGSYLYAAEDGT